MNQESIKTDTSKVFTLRRREFSILVAQSAVFTGEVLCQLLKEQGYNVVGRATELDDALHQIQVKQPQCVILDADLSGRNSFDLVQQARTDNRTTKFILYTHQPDLRFLGQAMQAGFFGFLHATDGLDELYRCFQTVSSGGCFYSSGFMAMLQNYGVDILPDETRRQLSKLSKREREVLRLVAQGIGGDKIAEHLHISYRTLANHKVNISHKLGIDSCRQLVQYSLHIRHHL